MITFERSY